MQNAVGVNVKGDLDLRQSACSRRNPGELELADGLVVHGQFALALQYVNLHRRLVVVRSAERLRLLGGNRRVARNQHGGHAAKRFNAERERAHVEKQHVLLLAREHCALNGRAHGYDFIRVHTLVRLLAEERLHHFLHLRNTRRATHEEHFVHFRRLHASVGERLLHGLERALDEVVHQLFELGARKLIVEMLRTGLVGGDERKIDIRAHRARQFDLRLLRRFFEALERHRVLGEVNRLILAELGHEPVNHLLVKVIAAEVRVAVGGLHLELLGAVHFVEFEHGDVVRAAAEIEHGNFLVLLPLLVEAVRECGGRRFVHDAQHFEARDLARVLGGLALRVVEVGRYRHDRLGHWVTEVVFGGLLHFLENHRRDFGRRVPLALHFHRGDVVGAALDRVGHAPQFFRDLRHLAPHEALDGEYGVLRVGHRLTFGDLPHEALAVLAKTDHRRRGPSAFRVRNDDRVASFHDGDHRVGGAQVDADNFVCHEILGSNFLRVSGSQCPVRLCDGRRGTEDRAAACRLKEQGQGQYFQPR